MSAITETTVENGNAQPLFARFMAQVVSYAIHPLFVPIYVTLFVLYVHPLLFAGFTEPMKLTMTATIFVNLCLLPAATVFLCWRLKFIDNLHLNTPKERVIPLAAAMIFYFWCWYVLKNNVNVPEPFRDFLLGSFITIIAAWMLNISFKVSLHALAAGGMLGFMVLLTFNVEGSSVQHLAAAVVLAGVVCTSRLLLRAHRPFEVYFGLAVGFLSQLITLIL